MTEIAVDRECRPRRLGGVALSLAAAATFGVFAPAAKGALAQIEPVRAAGLAYLAAGLVALAALGARRLAGSRPTGRRATRRDARRLLGITLFGGVLGPALFFAGVDRVVAHHAAVIQHLEFALTVLAAIVVLGERPGKRGFVGLVLVGAGVVLFSIFEVDPVSAGGFSWLGVTLLVAACAAWAVDNTLARGASDLDPLLVVAIKGIVAGVVLTLAAIRGAWSLEPRTWGLVFLAGGVGVGVSLVLELLALRRVGAALNAGLFATGPAFAFVWSLIFLGERSGLPGWIALALCVLGAVALAVDRHAHRHLHEPIRHTHRHRHLDGHHGHSHGSDFDPETEHVHEHEHRIVEHAHPHVHDEHHRHRHYHDRSSKPPPPHGSSTPAAWISGRRATGVVAGCCALYLGSLVSTGIDVGIGNHELQIPLVLELNDGSLYPHDPFVETLGSYPAPLWHIVAALARLAPLSPLLVILLALSRLFTLWAAGRLAATLSENNPLAILGAWTVVALAPFPAVGSGTIVSPLFEHTGVAVAMALLALAACVRGRPWEWAVYHGLAFNANPLYGIFALSYAATVWVARSESRRAWRSWIPAVLLAAVLSAPTALLVALGPANEGGGTVWFHALRAYYPYHFFPTSWSAWDVGRYAALVAIGLASAALWGRQRPFQSLLGYAAAAVSVGWVVLALVAGELLTHPMLVTLQPVRGTDLWYVYGAVLAIAPLACALTREPLAPWRAWFLGVAFLALVTVEGTVMGRPGLALSAVLLFTILFLVVRVWRWIGRSRPARWREISLFALVVPCVAVVALGAVRSLVGGMPLIRRPPAEVRAMADWARSATDREAVFLVPPSFGTFRALSQRSVFVDWKEGAAMLWDPPFAAEWMRRLGAIGITAEQLQSWHARGGDRFMTLMDAAYEQLDENTLSRVAEIQQPDFVILPAGHRLAIGRRGYRHGSYAVVGWPVGEPQGPRSPLEVPEGGRRPSDRGL